VRRRTEVYSSVEVRNLTAHLQGILAVAEYSQTGAKNGKDIIGERDLRGHVAEAQWPLGRDRQRISLSGRSWGCSDASSLGNA
jgi:hypothetical protein